VYSLEASARLTTDRESLRRRLEQLLPESGSANASAAVEAAAEAAFRLGLHPDTPSDEALSHLYRAVRLDGQNPKFSYHLALLHFRHGRLKHAGKWLRRTLDLCPTSHRALSHVALLQRILNEEYKKSSDNDPDALRTRSERIVAAIVNGADAVAEPELDFEPQLSLAKLEADARAAASAGRDRRAATAPEPTLARDGEKPKSKPRSPPKRTQQAGQCRWTGVIDLEAQALFAAEPTARGRDQLLERLARLRDLAEHRVGGTASLVVVGVLWLVAGYSPDSLQRLLPELLQRQERSVDLLRCSLELYQLERAQLPAALMQALRQRRIPPLLAAAIHRQRLLFQPVDFGGVRFFRRAVRMLADGKPDPGEAEVLVKQLNQSILAYFVAPRPPIADARPPAVKARLDAAAAVRQLSELEAGMGELKSLRQQTYDFLKQDLEARSRTLASEADAATVQIEHELSEQFVRGLERAGQACLGTLEELSAALAEIADLPSDFGARRDACKDGLTAVLGRGPFNNVLKRIAKNMSGASSGGAQSQPSSQLVAAVRRVEELYSLAENPPSVAGEAPEGDDLGASLARARELKQRESKLWAALKDLQGKHKDGRLDAADLDKLGEMAAFSDSLEQACKHALDAVAALRSQAEVASPQQVEQVEAAYRDLNQRPGRFRTALKKLPVPVAAPPPSAAAGPEPDLEMPPSPASTLEQAVALVRQVIEARQHKLVDTLAAYGPALDRVPELQLLKKELLAGFASLHYRLGDPMTARRHWSQLAALDPLAVSALKNLAVAASLAGEQARALSAWQAYAEAIYAFPILLDDPSVRATERRALHAAFADGFVPSVVIARSPETKKEDLEAAKSAFCELMRSPRALSTFVAHKRLEFLAAKLAPRSPSILLGVDRDATQSQRERARTRLQEFAAAACAALPETLRETSRAVYQRAADRAFELATDAKRRLVEHDPHYEEDKKQYVDWLKQVIALRYGFLIMMSRSEWVFGLRSAEPLQALLELEQIPIDLNPGLARTVAMQQGEDDALKVPLSELALNCIQRALLEANDEQSALRLHRALCSTWRSHSKFAEFESWLDLPQQMPGLPSLKDADEATWRKVARMLPHSSSARMQLAMTVLERDEAEALRLLEEARQVAISDALRSNCEDFAKQVAVRRRSRGLVQRLDGLAEARVESVLDADRILGELGRLRSDVEAEAMAAKAVDGFQGLVDQIETRRLVVRLHRVQARGQEVASGKVDLATVLLELQAVEQELANAKLSDRDRAAIGRNIVDLGPQLQAAGLFGRLNREVEAVNRRSVDSRAFRDALDQIAADAEAAAGQQPKGAGRDAFANVSKQCQKLLLQLKGR
jgi:hypothetical protein